MHDVEYTLLLTFALVVVVIFLFLRSGLATLIPAVTVPLALLGTSALMYVFGFSLDNLSLMALAIAVGFVVDDAIVMLENIYRHIEDGLSPFEGGVEGSGEIGFTILSISLSLVAVFIPLLLMGGIVGRLFREFALTVTMTILVSAFVSLTLSPMMCALFLRDEKHARHGRGYLVIERGFERMLAMYTRGLDVSSWVISAAPCWCSSGRCWWPSGCSSWSPKGFFPQQDTGIIFGLSDAAQDVSFNRMVQPLHQSGRMWWPRIRTLRSWGAAVGGGVRSTIHLRSSV